MKVAIYTRVSTLEQKNEGFSIDEQERKLKQFCDINDWQIQDVYIDAGISGGSMERPELKRLINNLDNIDMVLVYKLDRLTRSVRDLLELLEIFESNNVGFRSATEIYDTTNAMGRLFVTLVGAIAEFERGTTRERTISGKEGALNSGKYIGKVPFCYDLVDGELVPNEDRKFVDYIIERLKVNVSATQIAKELRSMKDNHMKWSKSTVLSTLHSPTLRGHTKYGKYFKENTHEPIISEDDYNQVTKIIGTRRNTYRQTHTSIFRGKIKCPNGCGRRLHLNTNTIKRADGTSYLRQYYKCDECSRKGKKSTIIRYDKVQDEFYRYLTNVSFNKFEPVEVEKEDKPEIDVPQIMRQREKYQRAWAMDLITDKEFEQRMKETDELLSQQSDDKDVDERYRFEQMKEISSLLQKAWSNLSEEKKEELVAATVDSITVDILMGNRKVNSPNEVEITGIDFLI